jgi:hypothetical protein
MRKSNKSLLTLWIAGLSLTLAMLLPNHAQIQKPVWKGKIVTENGIKAVKNPAEPLYGEFVFELEEDLSLGDPNDDNYYFPKGAVMTVDDQGNIYVVDMGNARIQKYDRSGRYLQTIGRKGQGPGEFQFPSHLAFDSEGNLWIQDSFTRSLSSFAGDGTFKRSTVLRESLQPYFFISKEGFIYGLEINPMAPGGPRMAVIKLNPDGTQAETIAEFHGELKPNQPWYALHSYTNRPFLCGLDSSSFCYGFSADYRIFLADSQGKTVLIIEKAEKPTPISGKEKESMLKQGSGIMGGVGRSRPARMQDTVVFPPHRPYFGRLFADDTGRIYVSRVPSILDKARTKVFDVFASDGIYLYRTKLPFWPEAIKAGSIYEIRRNEETGDIKIIRHRVKNWDKMKTGGAS